MVKINADVIVDAVAEGISDFFSKNSYPVTVHSRISNDRINAAQSGGPYMDSEIRSNERDGDREQSTTRFRPIRDDETNARIGWTKQYIYEMDLELTVNMPAGQAGSTYTRRFDSRTDEPATDDTPPEYVEARSFRFPSTRELGRVIDDALAHHDPDDGGYPFPDPRDGDDPDRYSDGVLREIDDFSIDQSGDRSRGGADADLLTWYQRLTIDWFRLVSTVDRDGPVQPITNIDFPGMDDWVSDVDNVWPGTVVAVADPRITPDDVIDDLDA